ncbi:MAG: hypothetical protein KIT73_12325 [Burkholderiales bacterium]|nr:hypothetical protein [Burkholderiales bacterium]
MRADPIRFTFRTPYDMGIVNMGPEAQITLDLAALAGISAFVETGTYVGNTTRWAAANFASVFTIERSETLHREYAPALQALGNVEPLLGDSRVKLPQVLARLGRRPAVFFLDGHWSGGPTSGADDECPLLAELQFLNEREGDVLLIDDARLILSAPPLPHDADQWPTIADVAEVLSAGIQRRFVQIVDDVIYVVPDVPELRQRLIAHARARAAATSQ